jgi:hypothetical protein
MEIQDSDNFLLVLFSVISVVFLFISSIWSVNKAERVLDVLYMTAITGLTFMVIHSYFPDSVPIAFDLKTGGVTSIVIILWIAIFKIGPAIAKFLVYVFTIFIIIPLVFYQNSAVITSYLANLLGIEVSIWFGFFIVMVIAILLCYFIYRVKLFSRLKSLAYLGISSFLIFYSIRLAIIEGPADKDLLEKCPFGFENYFVIIIFVIFAIVIILRLVCLKYCYCSQEKEEEEDKKERKKEKTKKPKTKTKKKQKYKELVEEDIENGFESE